MGCVVEKSPGNISSELKVQPIQNQTCTEYKTHSLVRPFWCYNSYWTKHRSIFGVFFKGHGFFCNILYLPKEQYVIAPCFDPDDLYEALTGDKAQKKYRAHSHLLHKQRETLRNLPGNFQCRERRLFPVKRGIWLLLTSSYPPAIQDLPPQQRLLNFKCHCE